MAARSPVRYLAPIALAVTLVAVAIVLASTVGGDSGGADRARPQATTEQRPARRTYVVRTGDTLVSISERFGVSQQRLLQLNPDVDAQALQTGTRLKLRP